MDMDFSKWLQSFQTNNFFLIAGPCAVESQEVCNEVCEKLMDITSKLHIPYIFKASFTKANRTRIDSFSGIGKQKALEVLAKVKENYGVPILTDIHESNEVKEVAQYADILQIPAFLCRQTVLLTAAGKTGKTVNIKKGQFSAPSAMKHAVDKVLSTGNKNILLTERGTTFGYQHLVVDMTAIPEMQHIGCPVVMDCTHAVQQPNQSTGVTGGKPAMIEAIAKAAVAVGVDGLFIETHPTPAQAKSDGANMLPLDKVEELLQKLVKIRGALA